MRIRLISSLLLLSALPVAAETCDKASYGKGVTLTESTPVAAILDQPGQFVGKEVRIEGEVQAVCEMAGCWLEVAASEGGEGGRTLKVKVKDGDIVFPVGAKGKRAVAQGKVEDLEMSRGKYVQYRKHAAKETGEPFDEKSLEGDGPFHVYQVAGSGAEICK